MASLNFDEDSPNFPHGQWHRAISGLGALVILAVIVLAILVAGYEYMHHDRHLTLFPGRGEGTTATNKAKPSPAIPFGAKPKVAPPPVVAALPADSVPQVITEAQTPGAQPIKVKAKDTEAVYAAKHQKIFGRGCDGRLELTATGLDFACTSGSEAPLHFAAAAIKGPSGNGIELKSGEKYHFDLRRSKPEEQQIFKDWVYTHVPGAYLARN